MNKQYEKLIQLIINEEHEKADKLFHKIVVEHSKKIYESMIDEEEDEVGDLMTDVEMDQEGMDADEIDSGDEGIEGDDDGDLEIDDDSDDEDEEIDLGDDDSEEPASEEDVEEIEDRVIDLEDKIDELMAQFEEMMASDDDADDGSDEPVEGDDTDEVEDEDFDVEGGDETDEVETGEGEEIQGDESEEDLDKQAEQLAEAYLRQVAAQHLDGSDSSARKSPVASNSGKIGMAGKPVRLGQDGAETGRTAPTAEVIYKSPKNAAGGSTGKLESAPRATNSQASGVNTKSIMSESVLDEAMDDSIVQLRAALKPVLSKYGLKGALGFEKKKGISWPIVSIHSGQIDFINNAANNTDSKFQLKEILETHYVSVVDATVKSTFTGKAATALNEIFGVFDGVKGYGKPMVRIGPKDGYVCTGTEEPLSDEAKTKAGLSESRKRKVR